MKTSEIREKTLDELIKMDEELRGELAALKLRHASGQLEKTHELPRMRKDIARAETIRREKIAAKGK